MPCPECTESAEQLWGHPHGGQEGIFVFTLAWLGAECGLSSPCLCLGMLDSYAVLTLFCVIFVVSG